MPAIVDGMFYGCTSLKSLKNLPAGIKTIGNYAFAKCTAFEEITLPISLEKIGNNAFDSTAITTITIPSSVNEIAAGAFTNCNKLTAINVDYNNLVYASVDGVLYDIALDTLITCPAGKTGAYKVYDGTSKINDGAFIGCAGLTVVEIPDSVTVIANNAFSGCSADLTIKANCGAYAAEYAAKRSLKSDLTHAGGYEWVVTTSATCLVDGAREKRCAGCGYVYETETLAALGHDYNAGEITTKATCTTDGVLTKTCEREGCGYYVTEVIPATGHSLSNETIVKEATCTEDGEKVVKCTNEGCTLTETTVIPATGHNYEAKVIKPATCREDGKMQYTCANCGDVYTEAIKGEHQLTTAKKDATCDAEGQEGQWCVVCNQFIGATTTIPAIGHNFVDGKCENCGKEDSNVKADGLHLIDGVWYYYVDNAVATDYTGLVYHNGDWYYVENGILNWDAITLAYHNGEWYYVEYGKVNFDAITLVYFYGEWYYVEYGKVNFDAITLVYFYGEWYYVEYGKVNFDATTLIYFYGKWYYVEYGVVNWNSDTLVYFYDDWYYVKDGTIAWDYTGYVHFYGADYYIVKGFLD